MKEIVNHLNAQIRRERKHTSAMLAYFTDLPPDELTRRVKQEWARYRNRTEPLLRQRDWIVRQRADVHRPKQRRPTILIAFDK